MLEACDTIGLFHADKSGGIELPRTAQFAIADLLLLPSTLPGSKSPSYMLCPELSSEALSWQAGCVAG